jgi:Fe-S-cluster-containing dehydrogenase component
LRKCTICNEEYNRNSKYCSPRCRSKAWYWENKKYKNQKSREWHLKHYVYKGRKKKTEEEKKKIKHEYYEKHKEKLKNYNKEYYLKHKDDAAYKEMKRKHNRAAYQRRKNRLIGV